MNKSLTDHKELVKQCEDKKLKPEDLEEKRKEIQEQFNKEIGYFTRIEFLPKDLNIELQQLLSKTYQHKKIQQSENKKQEEINKFQEKNKNLQEKKYEQDLKKENQRLTNSIIELQQYIKSLSAVVFNKLNELQQIKKEYETKLK